MNNNFIEYLIINGSTLRFLYKLNIFNKFFLELLHYFIKPLNDLVGIICCCMRIAIKCQITIILVTNVLVSYVVG
ncbi:hypothetical protein BH18THE1_BH18THE1_05360 [soil metagenome]